MSIQRSLAVLVASAVVLAGCSTSSNGVPAGSGASFAPGPSADQGPSSPGASQTPDLDAAEANLRQENRDRAGLKNLGPDAAELAGLMDAAGYKALQAEATKVEAAITGMAAAPSIRLASLTTPGSIIFAPWEFTTSWYERQMTDGVGNTRTTTDSDPANGPPGKNSGSRTEAGEPVTQETTIGGQPGSVTVTTTATVAFEGSKVSMDLEISLHGEVHDASGATVLRIDSVGKGHIDGDACPDASGIAAAHISFTASESYAGAGVASGSYGLEQDFSADVRIRADDNANLAGIEIAARAHETSTGGVPPAGGGSSDLAVHEYNAGFTRTLGYDATAGFGSATTTNESADSVQATSLYLGMAIFTEFPAKFAAKAAEKAWRSGMCIRVSPSPNGGSVAKDSATAVKVIVRQRYEDVELDKPVVATLDSGPKSIEPAGQPQPAPATFTYTAGPKDGDAGSVTFKSTSNRGIGQTSVSFKVGGGFTADRQSGESTIKGQKCNGLDGVWTLVTIIKNSQLEQTETYLVTINGTTLVGTMTVKGVTTSFPGIVTTTVGGGRASIVAQADGTLTMTFSGTKITNTSGPAVVTLSLPDQIFTWSPGGTCP